MWIIRFVSTAGVEPDVGMYHHLLKAFRFDCPSQGGWDPDVAMGIYHRLRGAALAPSSHIFRELFSARPRPICLQACVTQALSDICINTARSS